MQILQNLSQVKNFGFPVFFYCFAVFPLPLDTAAVDKYVLKANDFFAFLTTKVFFV
jgi:hypothetical protein